MDNLEKRKLAHKADKLTEYSNKSFELDHKFITTILKLSVTVLGIILALSQSGYDYSNYSMSIRILYSVALGMLSLGILALSICLYGFVRDHRELVRQYANKLSEYIEGDQRNAIYVSPKTPRIYVYAEYVGYISLLSSVICFVNYLIGIILF